MPAVQLQGGLAEVDKELVLLFVWLFVCLFVCLLVCLFACLFVCLFGCLLLQYAGNVHALPHHQMENMASPVGTS